MAERRQAGQPTRPLLFRAPAGTAAPHRGEYLTRHVPIRQPSYHPAIDLMISIRSRGAAIFYPRKKRKEYCFCLVETDRDEGTAVPGQLHLSISLPITSHPPTGHCLSHPAGEPASQPALPA
jgi:hypothetical protein